MVKVTKKKENGRSDKIVLGANIHYMELESFEESSVAMCECGRTFNNLTVGT